MDKKLYVWEKVLENYYYGIAFAYASNPDEAREAILTDFKQRHPTWDHRELLNDLAATPEVYTKVCGFSRHGSS